MADKDDGSTNVKPDDGEVASNNIDNIPTLNETPPPKVSDVQGPIKRDDQDQHALKNAVQQLMDELRNPNGPDQQKQILQIL